MKKLFIIIFFIASIATIWINAHGQTWNQLLDRADSLSEAQNQDSAIVIGKLALEKAMEQYGETDTVTALILHKMGGYYYKNADYTEAETMSKKALKVRKTVLGENHPEVAKSLRGLAIIYKRQGKYEEAVDLYESAQAILEERYGAEDLKITTNLNGLAYIYRELGRYHKAELLSKKALTIREKALGLEHTDIAVILDNLAITYRVQGKYSDAEPLLERSLAIRKKALNPNDPKLARSLNLLGILYWREGKYAKAELMYSKALSIWENSLGPNNTLVATALNNLALLYKDQGRYSDAEAFYLRAIDIRKKDLWLDRLASNLNNLANLFIEQGKYSNAETLYIQALTIWEKSLGQNHPTVALALSNLASLYIPLGEYDKSELYFRRAMAIRDSVLGQNHPLVASSKASLAALYSEQRLYIKAESLYNEALAICETALGAGHPYYASYIGALCENLRLKEDKETSLIMSKRALEIRQNNFQENAYVLSEKDALTYSQLLRNSTNTYLSCFFDAKSDKDRSMERTCNIVLVSKGQVSDDIFRRRKALVAETESTIIALAESLRHTKFQISQLYVSGPGDDTTGVYRQRLDSLSNLANEFEADLARQSASFGKQQSYKDVSTERIASLLPPKCVLIEYVKYDYYQLKPDSTIPRYLVLVIDNDGTLDIRNLGEGSEIDTLISNYRKHMVRVSSQQHLPLMKDQEEYEDVARKLYDAIIRPVEVHISDRDHVFIAPDGGLNLVSFAGLIDDEGKYLIEKFPIHYLSAGRDLIRLQDTGKRGNGLFALGAPDYDATGSVELASVGVDPYVTRNVRSGCGDLREIIVETLPHSRQEIEQIIGLWEAENRGSAFAFLGPDATEDNFKAEATGKSVIHLATHGFFLEGRCNPSKQRSSFIMDQKFIGENPLLLSGLFLAGANQHGRTADSLGIEDGILTAYEVSAMNLEGTNLVVLSACETGLGEVKQGEGVYGLRRAFQMAGARTVVSALWPVPDKATSEMMANLYSHSEKSLPERIRNMQLAQIKKLRAEGFSDHPYTWAGFIALGDWR